MNIDDKIAYLRGEVDGLKTVCMALIATHPNPAAVEPWLEILSQMALAKNSETLAPEIALDASRAMIEDFRKSLQLAQAQATHGRAPPAP